MDLFFVLLQVNNHKCYNIYQRINSSGCHSSHSVLAVAAANTNGCVADATISFVSEKSSIEANNYCHISNQNISKVLAN
jgi:hypothetical protein